MCFSLNKTITNKETQKPPSLKTSKILTGNLELLKLPLNVSRYIINVIVRKQGVMESSGRYQSFS